MGRHLSFVECRESMGLGVGGGLAARATISESGRDVVAVAMGPGRRHITKPVCEITYCLREEGIDTSVLVLNAGGGVPQDAPDVTTIAAKSSKSTGHCVTMMAGMSTFLRMSLAL